MAPFLQPQAIDLYQGVPWGPHGLSELRKAATSRRIWELK